MNMGLNMKKQSGIGFVQVIILVALLASNFMIAINVIPAYFEYYKLKTVLNSFSTTPIASTGSRVEIMTALTKRMHIDDIRSIKQKDIEIKLNREAGSVKVDYEVRKSLFSNIDLVMHFEEIVEFDR